MIVVIEGADAVGKATQSRMLAERFGGKVQDFPNYRTPTGQLIRKMLTGAVSLINPEHDSMPGYDRALALQALMTVNRYEHTAMLRAAAESRELLVLDRYWASGYVYGTADGLDADWLIGIHECLPQPAAWILLDAPVEVGFRCRPERRDAYERDAEKLGRVRKIYLDFFHQNDRYRGPGSFNGQPWAIVDADRPIEDVHADVVAVVKAALPGLEEKR